MPYGETNKLLKDASDDVLIESPFKEVTRDGLPKASVLLALTKKQFIIASKRLYDNPNMRYNQLETELALEDVDLSIFKRTRRQVLKASFCNNTVKYFELGAFKKRKIFWDIWCNHVRELRKKGLTIWPFQYRVLTESSAGSRDCYQSQGTFTTNTCNHSFVDGSSQSPPRSGWNDKYLFLGAKRESDNIEHSPVPVVGPGCYTFLKENPQAIESYTPSEYLSDHKDSLYDSLRDITPVCTYTGEPTSNVTYMSLLPVMRGDETSTDR